MNHKCKFGGRWSCGYNCEWPIKIMCHFHIAIKEFGYTNDKFTDSYIDHLIDNNFICDGGLLDLGFIIDPRLP